MVPVLLDAMGMLAGMPGNAGSEFILRAPQTVDEDNGTYYRKERMFHWSRYTRSRNDPQRLKRQYRS